MRVKETASPIMRRLALLEALACLAVMSAELCVGCSEERRSSQPEVGCICDPDCPPGVCDLEICLDSACARPVHLVVDREEVGELEPGKTYRSCDTNKTWKVGETVSVGVVPGTQPYFMTEQIVCTEDVDHIRPTWRCSR